MNHGVQSEGILERLTPPTLRSLYLFWLMQLTQSEIDPTLLHDTIHASASLLQRATLNMLELETLLKVRIITGRLRNFVKRQRSLPTDSVVTQTLGHAERLLVRRTTIGLTSRRRQQVGGIALLAAKAHRDGGIRHSR